MLIGNECGVHATYTDPPNSEDSASWARGIFNKLFVLNTGTYSDSPRLHFFVALIGSLSDLRASSHSLDNIRVRTAADCVDLVIWQRHGSRRICGNRDGEAVIALFPVGNNCAVGGVILSVKSWERGIEMWVNG